VFRLACFEPASSARVTREKGWTGFRARGMWGESKTVRLVACYRRHVAILLPSSPFSAVSPSRTRTYAPDTGRTTCELRPASTRRASSAKGFLIKMNRELKLIDLFFTCRIMASLSLSMSERCLSCFFQLDCPLD